MSSLKRHDGEVMIDNRANGGAPVPGMGNVRFLEAPTITCAHCAGVWMVNPLRTRPRNYCRKCDRYTCDACAVVASQPNYTHRSFKELADLVTSEKAFIAGGTPSAPILITTGDFNG